MPLPKTYASNKERQAAYRQRMRAARQQERNQKGLPALPAIPTMPGSARWSAGLSLAASLLEQVSSEMSAWFDARSESWQQGERGEAFAERLTAIEALSSDLGELCQA